MFKCVVYRNSTDHSYSVQTFIGSKPVEVVDYSNIEALPDDIKDAVKQMLWVDPDDHTPTTNLGIRVGDNTFWIMENGT